MPEGRSRDADPVERALRDPERGAEVSRGVAHGLAVVALHGAIERPNRSAGLLDGHLGTERGLRRDTHPPAPRAERGGSLPPHLEICPAVVAVGRELLGRGAAVAPQALQQAGGGVALPAVCAPGDDADPRPVGRPGGGAVRGRADGGRS